MQHRCPVHSSARTLGRPLRSAAPIITPTSRRAVTVNAVWDASSRVQGEAKLVWQYVANQTTRPSWYPGVKDVTVIKGGGEVAPGMRYRVKQQIAGLSLDTTYEVVEVQRDKKVVLSAASEVHTATEQFVFMPDPRDKNYTVVRYMMKVELNDWKRALQPVIFGVLSKAPEQALASLTKLLASPDSPIPKLRATARPSFMSGFSQSSYASQASTSYDQDDGRGRFAGAFDNLGAMFSGIKSTVDNMKETVEGTVKRKVQKKAAPAPPPPPRPGDVYGFYQALGLDPGAEADDIRSAFRKVAMKSHPDKFTSASERERAEAEDNFKRIQRAYEVLRDPEQRSKYDSGKLNLGEGESAASSRQYSRA